MVERITPQTRVLIVDDQDIIIEKLRRELGGHGDIVTMSIGVASVIPSSKDGVLWLIDRAGRALYEAKRRGRDRVCSFADGIQVPLH